MQTRFLAILFMVTLLMSITFGIIGCQTPAAPTTPSVINETPATTRTVTDMLGRKVTVPVTINRVLGSSPMESSLLVMIAPEKLVGVTMAFTGKPALISDSSNNLPVVGGWYGPNTANYETFISMKPDVVIEGQQQSLEERQSKLGSIPVFFIDTWNVLPTLDMYPDWINYTANLLGVETQANSLIAYLTEAQQYVKGITSQISESEKIKVYYAEGNDGLSTDPTHSSHTELVDFCGGINVADVVLKPGYGMAEVSLESIIGWDPDMIIIGRGAQASLYKIITTDPKWGKLRAVKNKQVYIRPDNPLSWFDGPPCTNQIIGLYWTVNKFFPEKTKGLDLNGKIKEFYSKFYKYDLTDEQIRILLANPAD